MARCLSSITRDAGRQRTQSRYSACLIAISRDPGAWTCTSSHLPDSLIICEIAFPALEERLVLFVLRARMGRLEAPVDSFLAAVLGDHQALLSTRSSLACGIGTGRPASFDSLIKHRTAATHPQICLRKEERFTLILLQELMANPSTFSSLRLEHQLGGLKMEILPTCHHTIIKLMITPEKRPRRYLELDRIVPAPPVEGGTTLL